MTLAFSPSELLDTTGFQKGFAAGVVALVIVAVGALVVRAVPRWRRTPLPVVALASTVAILVALDRTAMGIENPRLVRSIAVLAAGPVIAAFALARFRFVNAVAAAAAIPGAVMLTNAVALEHHRSWVPTLVFAVTVGGGFLVAEFDRVNARSGLGPVLLVVAVLGMYGTLPDTELIAVVVGATVPLLLLGTPIAFGSLGPGTFAAIGLLGWVAAVEGSGRPAAIVGALASLGVMLVEPLARLVWGRRARVFDSPLSVSAVLVIGLQVLVVAATSRLAGVRHASTSAALICGITLAGTAVALTIMLAPRTRHRSRHNGGRAPAPA